MASGQTWYGSVKPHYFKFTKAGVGVAVTLELGDVKLSKDGGAPADIALIELTAVDETNMTGVYKWTPGLAAQTQCETVIITVKELAGTDFDENFFTFHTGGHASAFFDAGA